MTTHWFDCASNAYDVLNTMRKLIDTYGNVTVSDYLDLIGSETNPNDDLYGWTDLSSACVASSEDVYNSSKVKRFCIDFPGASFLAKTKDAKEKDMVNHPDHYKAKNGLEVIDVVEAFTFDLKGIEATDTGNIIKYICRWKHKNGLEDLKKAQWYLNHLINHIEKESK